MIQHKTKNTWTEKGKMLEGTYKGQVRAFNMEYKTSKENSGLGFFIIISEAASYALGKHGKQPAKLEIPDLGWKILEWLAKDRRLDCMVCMEIQMLENGTLWVKGFVYQLEIQRKKLRYSRFSYWDKEGEEEL